MRLNSKGQATIPAALRKKYRLQKGDELDVIEVRNILQIVRAGSGETRGQRLVRGLRGRASTTMSTDELMEPLRSE
ncbi:AbrB family looped-hinge helix DNA binding protein [Streptomyces sp. 846.5]|nr:AbrB/MazE/SpoVT family DNA-binding domain-containing protein [Streptomyces sp. 846.5]TDU03058.1 AbrB family looped-hinge helix DNA binding protein [Streptomyces sp. 846.5]